MPARAQAVHGGDRRPGEGGRTAESGRNSASWTEREERRHRLVRTRTIGVGLLILGTLGLSLCPVFFAAVVQANSESHGSYHTVSDEAMAAGCARAAGALLVGWLLLESGLGLLRPRRKLQILARVPMYLYIVLMCLFLAAIYLLSTLPLGPLRRGGSRGKHESVYRRRLGWPAR